MAPVAERGEFVLQLFVRFFEFRKPAFEIARRVAHLAYHFAVGLFEKTLVQFEPLLLVLRVEIVRFGFEQNAENIAVALDDIVENHAQRVVTGFEFVVLLPQLIRRVAQSVFGRRVEQHREDDIVQYGDAQPRQQFREQTRNVVSYRAVAGRLYVIALDRKSTL